MSFGHVKLLALGNISPSNLPTRREYFMEYRRRGAILGIAELALALFRTAGTVLLQGR